MNLIQMISLLKNISNGYLYPFDRDLRLFVPNDRRTALLEVKYDGSPDSNIVGDIFPYGEKSLPIFGRLVQNEKVCLFHGDRFKLEKEDGSFDKLFFAVDEEGYGLSLFRESDRESILISDLHPSRQSLYPWMRKHQQLFHEMLIKFNGFDFCLSGIIEIKNQLICGTFVEAEIIHRSGKLMDASYKVLIPAAWAQFTGYYMKNSKDSYMRVTEDHEYYDKVYDLCRAESLKYGTSHDLVDWEDDNFEE